MLQRGPVRDPVPVHVLHGHQRRLLRRLPLRLLREARHHQQVAPRQQAQRRLQRGLQGAAGQAPGARRHQRPQVRGEALVKQAGD